MRYLLALLVSTLAYPVSAAATKIGVADFTSDGYHSGLTRGLPDLITDQLVNTGEFDVFEREKLSTVMQEQGFQESGFVDPKNAVEAGKLVGVDYIVTGKIIDYGREVRQFSGYNVRSETTFYRLKANIKVVDIATGRIVFSRSSEAEETQVGGQSMRISDDTIDTRLTEAVAEDFMTALWNRNLFQNDKEDGPTLAEITIASVPENADVEIDGVFYGNAGDPFNVPVGLRNIRISLPGYESWDKKVMVRDGLTFKATLTKKVDTRIEIETNSDDAKPLN